jgi:hypothetical protein
MPWPGVEVQALSPRGGDRNVDAQFGNGNTTIVPGLWRFRTAQT